MDQEISLSRRASSFADSVRAAAAMQWAELAPSVLVVATGDGAWLHRLLASGIGDPLSEPMQGSATTQSTRNLLDGAWAAARRLLVAGLPRPPLTAVRWAWRLAWQYHTSHKTPLLLTEAMERFRSQGRNELVECCARQIEEESGHDELALRDLRALGYNAEAVVAAFRPPTAFAVVDYFADCVRSASPVRYLGYSYALERSSMGVGRDYVEAIEALLPVGVKATRCLRVHSALGTDARHVAEAIELVARLESRDRALIARACYETTCIMQARLAGDDPPEAELEQMLTALRASH